MEPPSNRCRANRSTLLSFNVLFGAVAASLLAAGSANAALNLNGSFAVGKFGSDPSGYTGTSFQLGSLSFFD